ncbi:polyisoprenoid-binding protein [bacterium]|nr:polyisoprenoid-binding protein [bacterium]NBX81910.1 polyisoprenoid-binding protein [bacterium]
MKHWALVSLGIFALPIFAGVWEIDDAHTAAKFKIRHLMVSNVYGQITGAKGALDMDDKDLTKTQGTVTLEVNTVNTANEKRDAHLKNEDFFDVSKHPTITFQIKKVVKASGGKWRMDGDLTMKGITKPITLKEVELTPTIKDPWGATKRGLTGVTSLNRKDFGLTWNKQLDGGGMVIGDKVDIEVAMELKEKTEAAKN